LKNFGIASNFFFRDPSHCSQRNQLAEIAPRAIPVCITIKEDFMKKLVAILGLTLAAMSANATEVRLYGLVDLGISATRANGQTNVEMKSGMRNSSRFGLKGTEDLSNGYKIGFILESQFKADSGVLQTEGTLWERESSLIIDTPYGKIMRKTVSMPNFQVMLQKFDQSCESEIRNLNAVTVVGRCVRLEAEL
jgi:hypothetical protein